MSAEFRKCLKQERDRSHGRGWRTERKVKQTWTEIG